MFLFLCSVAIAVWVFVFARSAFELHAEAFRSSNPDSEATGKTSPLLFRIFAPYIRTLGSCFEGMFCYLRQKRTNEN